MHWKMGVLSLLLGSILWLGVPGSALIEPVLAATCGPKGAQLVRAPKGGCYYINRNGNETYVDRSCCN